MTAGRRTALRAGRALLLSLALATVGVARGAAQTPASADTVTGRVIAADSTPIPSARVTATDGSGREFSARSDPAGRYLLVIPGGDGSYSLTVAAFGFLPFTTTVARAPGATRIERTVRLNARRIVLDTLSVRVGSAGSTRTSLPAPGATSQDWPASSGFIADPGDLAAIAALQAGILAGGDGSVSIAGQSPDQNRTTLDGATSSDLTLPAEGVRSVLVVANTYDPARGQFSGGEIAARSLAGTNRWGGAMGLRLDDPALRYGGAPGAGLGRGDRTVRWSGGGGGPLRRDRLFAYGALDVSSTRGPVASLDPADRSTLRRLGISADSARRFVDVVDALGLPAPGFDDRRSTVASGLARLDYTISDRHSLTLRVNGRASRSEGFDLSPFSRVADGGRRSGQGFGTLGMFASDDTRWSNELRVYASDSETTSEAAVPLPVAHVRVASVLEDGSAGEASFQLAGSTTWFPDSRSRLREVADDFVLRTGEGTHRLKIGILLQEEDFTRQPIVDHGSFTFASLGDLESGRPASFSRSASRDPVAIRSRSAALYLGSDWYVSREISLIGGARFDVRELSGRRPVSAAVEPLADGRGRAMPRDHGISPRLGFAIRPPGTRTVVNGGAGLFRGVIPLSSLAGVWNETGEATDARLVCIGSAAPVPDWPAYASGPGAIPTACADGSSAYASSAPAATLFGHDLAAPRAWRASLGAATALTPVVRARIDGLVSFGSRHASARDLNRVSPPQFTLREEGGRPVFAASSAIDPVTGGIGADASRRDPALGAVRLLEGRARSRTVQIVAGVDGILRGAGAFALTYTHTRARDEAAGVPVPGGALATTAGDAARREWAASDHERRHALQAMLSRSIARRVSVSAIARLTSGLPYTPRVAGDVNGDGFSNDRAFVFDPDEADDPVLREGMGDLLEGASSSVRDCLRNEMGTIARRNACRTPWSSSLDLRARIALGRDIVAQRATITVSATNVTAALDHLLHGPDDLRGWGESPLVDPTLLTVRSFDPDARAFRYAVNPNFGGRPGGGLLRTPFALVLEGRVTLGADPRRQSSLLRTEALGAGGTLPARLRAQVAERARNLPATVLALDEKEPGTLGLTAPQAERLRSAAASLAPRLDAALTALAEALASPGGAAAARRATIEDRAADVHRLVEEGTRATRSILTPLQWDLLPRWLTEPPRIEELESPTFQMTLPMP